MNIHFSINNTFTQKFAPCFSDFHHKEEKNKKSMVNKEKKKDSNIFSTWTCCLFSSHDLSSLQLIHVLFTKKGGGFIPTG